MSLFSISNNNLQIYVQHLYFTLLLKISVLLILYNNVIIIKSDNVFGSY